MADFSFEEAHRAQGKTIIAGIDEAGRGPLAGPVCAAAVILPEGYEIDGLTDSKKLSEKKRETLYEILISDSAVISCVAWGSVKDIEEFNILQANHRTMRKAALGLEQVPEVCLIDGLAVPDFPFESEAIVKGDSKSLSIAAASILAKVSRDRYMQEMEVKYPGYGFAKHKGYGTKAHMEAIRTLGPCEIHRKTFAPIAQRLLEL